MTKYFAAAVGSVMLLSVAACNSGTQTIDANTTCKSFMTRTQTDRDNAVVRIASERHDPDATTPLGRPNVEFQCSTRPDATLGTILDEIK